MNNLISKMGLLLLCSVFALSSCSDDDSTEKKTVTVKYRILINADRESVVGEENEGLKKLYQYTNKEMEAVSKVYDTEAWTITETAETEEAAITACDKKAITAFDAKLSAMNAAALSVKEKFDAKKRELLSEIIADTSTAYVLYKNYGGYLFKTTEDILFPDVVVKNGTLFDLEAVAGDNDGEKSAAMSVRLVRN